MTRGRKKRRYPFPRTFLRRQGHVTSAQKRALQEHWTTFGLDARYGDDPDLDQAFGRAAWTGLEIGFGMGEHLAAAAARWPERNYLGIEPHRPGVGALVKRLADDGLTNARVIHGDALYTLSYVLTRRWFDEVFLFFPDPWHRQNKRGRRLVQPLVVDLLTRRVKPNATLHLATDVQDYADQMMEVMGGAEGWENDVGQGLFAPRPEWRPVTKYEEKAREEGRGVWELRFVFRG